MAQAGYDANSAPLEKMIFTTDWPTLRVKYTGVVTASNIPGPWSQIYDTAIFTYPEPFPQPPIVLVAGILNSTTSDQNVIVETDYFTSGNYSYRSPWYAINSLNDRFELYVMARFASGAPHVGRTKTYRYYVFDSVIAST